MLTFNAVNYTTNRRAKNAQLKFPKISAVQAVAPYAPIGARQATLLLLGRAKVRIGFIGWTDAPYRTCQERSGLIENDKLGLTPHVAKRFLIAFEVRQKFFK